jgi:glutamate dehydrogenase/leucine dehydrogenase
VNRSFITVHATAERGRKGRLQPAASQLLRSPMRRRRVAVPIGMDGHSTTRVVEGLGVQHDDARRPFYRDRVGVLSRIDSRIQTAFGDVYERSEREQVSLRDAAFVIAAERVARAYDERGWV